MSGANANAGPDTAFQVVLSKVEIVNALERRDFEIANLAGLDLAEPPLRGCPTDAPNQFKGQINPIGEVPEER